MNVFYATDICSNSEQVVATRNNKTSDLGLDSSSKMDCQRTLSLGKLLFTPPEELPLVTFSQL